MPDSKKKQEMNYRTISLSTRADDGGKPSSLDEENRSVEVIGSTENPVDEYDWHYGIMPTILRMDGIVMPESRQIPLLDTHSRWSTETIMGSYRGMETEKDKLVGRAFFSSVEEAEKTFTKIREGHLTDFSIGYQVLEATRIKEDESGVVGGKTYLGPVKVVTKWRPRELSCCPIGADEMAKVRAEASPDENRKQNQEENVMPKKEKETQEENHNRNLSPDSGETNPQPQNQRSDPPVDTEAIRAEAARQERERVTDITAICDQAGLPDDIRASLIKEGKTVDQARQAALDHVCDDSPNLGHRSPVDMGVDERDKFRSAAEDSIILRVGTNIEKPAEGARDLMGFSMREMARECLRRSRKPIYGNVMDMVGRALTTSDFPYILANVANKELFQGWETAEETYRDWVGFGSVSDFKVNSLVRPGEYDDLLQILEDGEYKLGSRTEAREQYQLAKYGRRYIISREAIINDDLGALSDVPRGHGEAAARLEGDIVYAVLVSNANMGDSIALFHADHTNLGTAGAPSETTLAEGIGLMKKQKGIGGKSRLNIRPVFYIAPVSLEGSSEIFFLSNRFSGANAASTRENPYAGSRFTRVYDPRLDDNSETEWYLAAKKGMTVKLFHLNGNRTPYMESRQGFTVDGVEYKVRHEAVAKAVDWKGLFKNPYAG